MIARRAISTVPLIALRNQSLMQPPRVLHTKIPIALRRIERNDYSRVTAGSRTGKLAGGAGAIRSSEF
jgi:hypothetical protein